VSTGDRFGVCLLVTGLELCLLVTGLECVYW